MAICLFEQADVLGKNLLHELVMGVFMHIIFPGITQTLTLQRGNTELIDNVSFRLSSHYTFNVHWILKYLLMNYYNFV